MASGADDDGHHIEIDGRRWRATDPAIPATFRQELVNGLMAARRDVGAARRAADAEAEDGGPLPGPGRQGGVGRARRTVVGAGDGRRTPPSADGHRAHAAAGPAAGVVDLPERRRPRRRGAAWRTLVPLARDIAAELARAGVVIVTQGDRTVDALTARGPVRIRRAGGFA